MARARIYLAGMLLAVPCALALNPALDVSRYAHKAWKNSDGSVRGAINSVAQTPDGYLWLGTDFGLVRFDGVRTVDWKPTNDQTLPSSEITNLLGEPDGTLWIGTSKGLVSWKNGRLVQYPALENQRIARIVADPEGRIWVGGLGRPTGRLCAIQNESVQCYGDDGLFDAAVLSLYEYRNNLWVGAISGLWRWKPGPPQRYLLPDPLPEIRDLIEGDNGALWIAARGGIRQFLDGKIEPYPIPLGGQFNPSRLLRDREGGLWIGTSGQGLVHVHQGRTDVFASADGLSSDRVYGLFEDREGNIWVGTDNGLDRFRDYAIPTISFQRLSGRGLGTALAAVDGSIWFGTGDGLSRWNNGQLTIYRTPGRRRIGRAAANRAVREIHDDGLPDNLVQSIFQDDGGRIWVSTPRGVAFWENDRFRPVPAAPTMMVHSISEESAGNIWINDQILGLFHLVDGRLMERIPWNRLGDLGYATTTVPDGAQGLWLGFAKGGVGYFKNGEVRATYTAATGLGAGPVDEVRLDREGALWAATEGGLSRIKDGHVRTLSGKNGLPCEKVHWTLEDDAHSFWLYLACGLVRIERPELNAWIADPNHILRMTALDNSDGVETRARSGGYTPRATKAPDGKLWFWATSGLSVIDPRHLPFNKLAPQVHVEQVIADRKTYAADTTRRLPPLTRDLEIDYTALSLVAPEKNRFRYKLEGHDRDWQDAGNRRQAFYNDLPPRNYRFRVMACNNSGVWNEAGAFFDFSVKPAYYQTTWFRAACVAAFLALLGALHQLRLQYMRRQFNIRLAERVAERTRIARDLHDTLLQSFQGVLLRFHAVTYKLPDRSEVRADLENVIEAARTAITEGRDAVQGLRSSTLITNDLARSLGTLGEELAGEQAGGKRPQFRVQVEGKTRDLPPLVRDEVYRTAAEAMRNAYRHAGARRIEVDIHYDKRQFGLRVRDDGKGIDQHVLDEGGRAGHHGLPGMHERAKLVGGKLAVWSELDSGTEIELTIPAVLAYAKTPASSRPVSSTEGVS